jgi:hypothetical protein
MDEKINPDPAATRPFPEAAAPATKAPGSRLQGYRLQGYRRQSSGSKATGVKGMLQRLQASRPQASRTGFKDKLQKLEVSRPQASGTSFRSFKLLGHRLQGQAPEASGFTPSRIPIFRIFGRAQNHAISIRKFIMIGSFWSPSQVGTVLDKKWVVFRVAAKL